MDYHFKHTAFVKNHFTQPTRPIDADGNKDPQCVDVPKLYWKEVYGITCGNFNGAAAKADQDTFPG